VGKEGELLIDKVTAKFVAPKAEPFYFFLLFLQCNSSTHIRFSNKFEAHLVCEQLLRFVRSVRNAEVNALLWQQFPSVRMFRPRN
jgi:hypothetical protein